MTKTATTLVTGRCRGRISSRQHPDRQGRLLAGGEGGDDDLVEGQREGEHAAGEQRGADLRQDHVPEGLEAVGAEIHRGFDQIARQPAEPGDGVVVDHHDAERGVAEHDGPDREIDAHDVEGRTQRDAGDDAGKRDRQHEQQARSSRGRRSVARDSAAAASVPKISASTVAIAATSSER